MNRRFFITGSTFLAAGYGFFSSTPFFAVACNSSNSGSTIYPAYDSFDTVLNESELPEKFFVEDSLNGGVFEPLEGKNVNSVRNSIIKYRNKYFNKVKGVEISIEQFGGIGDGKTNNSTAILKAFDFLNKNKGEYILIFPQGEYTANVTVSSNNAYIKGEGTIVPYKGNSEFALRINGNNNTISGLNFNEKVYCRNLLIVHGDNNNIVNCKFKSPNKSTLNSIPYSDKLLYLSKDTGVGNVIKNCHFTNGRIGVCLCGSYQLLDSEVSNCIMGIYARPSSRNVEIAGNIIRDNNVNNKSGADGIYCQRNVSKVHIHDNKISNSGEHGIYFQGDNSIIEKNEVFNNHGSGIKLASYTDQLYNVTEKEKINYLGYNNIIRNNRCYNNCRGVKDTTNAGIYLQAPLRDIEISGNVCYKNFHGIRSTSVANVKVAELERKTVLQNLTISGNDLYDNRGRSIYVEGEFGVVIQNNSADDILTNAKSASHRLRGAIIKGNKIRGELHINRAENTVIEDNEINQLSINNNSKRKNVINLNKNRIKNSNLR